MSLLEWFLEPRNPGPVGKVDVNAPDPDDDGNSPKKWLIYLAAALGFCMAATGLYWTFNNMRNEGTIRTLTRLFYLGLYLLASQFIKPAPDNTNMGWMGGLVDNPFRISDDYNRLLLLAQVILLPGRVVAYCLMMGWLMGRYFLKMLRR